MAYLDTARLLKKRGQEGDALIVLVDMLKRLGTSIIRALSRDVLCSVNGKSRVDGQATSSLNPFPSC
ncbi:MAG: hypothetical protein R3F31_03990 [Verrucomicrobiales bacterium]